MRVRAKLARRRQRPEKRVLSWRERRRGTEEERDGGVKQLAVRGGSHLQARLASSGRSHSIARAFFVGVFLFFFLKNTVSIMMLRVASRGMIILSYYRLPDAARTLPLPPL